MKSTILKIGLLTILVIINVHAQNTLDIPDIQTYPGASAVSVPIYLNNPSDYVSGIQFTFHFNPNLMDFIDVQSGQRLPESFNVNYNCMNDSIMVIIISLSGDSLPPGNGEISVIHFNIEGTAQSGDSVILWFSGAVLSSPQGTPLPVNTDNGILRIYAQPRAIVQAFADTTQPGGDASIAIELQNFTDAVSGIQFTLRYNGTALFFDTLESCLPSSFTCNFNIFSDSTKILCVSLSGDSLLPPNNNIGLAYFEVSRGTSPDDSLTIVVDDVVISDPQAQNIPSTGIDGYIGIAPPVPEILQPASGTFLGTRTFDAVWTSVSSAAAYFAELSNHSDFSFLLDSLELVDTTHSFTVDSDGFYFVRVRSMSSRGYASDWSPIDSFGVDVTPPSVDSMTVWADTAWFFGPFEVDAWISDNLSGVGSAWLFWSVDGAPFDSTAMSLSGGVWSGEFPAFSDSANHTVSYFVKALDNAEPANVSTSDTVSFAVTSISEGERQIPSQFDVLGVMPNPTANGRVVLKLALPQRTSVHVVVYDAAGRAVWKEKREVEAGYVGLPLELPSASGVYFVKVSTRFGHRTLKVLSTHR